MRNSTTDNLTNVYDEEDDQKGKLPSMRVYTVFVGILVVALLAFAVVFIVGMIIMSGAFGSGLSMRRTPDGTRILVPVHNDSPMNALRRRVSPERIGLDRSEQRANAVILILCRNREMHLLLDTLRQFEDRFNQRFHYPYVFLNDVPFTPEFEYSVRAALPGRKLSFGLVPREHWSFPEGIDREEAKRSRQRLGGIVHGGSQSYRFMCRYFSGFFYKHPLLEGVEWFWRIEPGVSFPCDIPIDPFRKMEKTGKVYGFSIAMSEIMETIPGLWNATVGFMKQHPNHVAGRNALLYLKNPDGTFNGCHFWNNFEIARLSFFRSPQYEAYFGHLERQGGFFYERWGDAPVHSLAVGMFLRPDQIEHFDNIGYRHEPSSFCPADPQVRRKLLCSCDPYEASDAATNECMAHWRRFRATGSEAAQLQDDGAL